MFLRKELFFKRLMSCFVVTKQHKKVLSIQINRPEVRNAVNKETASQLRQAFRQFESNENCRVAVLSGSSGTFCAGYDLSEVSRLDEREAREIFMSKDGPMGPTRDHFSKPIIGAISGYAVGGGLELALLCDMRVIEEDVILGFFNRRFGVPLIDGGTVRLSKLIGLSRAMDLILTGRSVNSDEALHIGLANRVVPKGTAYSEALALANQIAAFPQTCLSADRHSAYYAMWNATSMDNALQFENVNAEDCVKEATSGADRFVAGSDCGGTFEEHDK